MFQLIKKRLVYCGWLLFDFGGNLRKQQEFYPYCVKRALNVITPKTDLYKPALTVQDDMDRNILAIFKNFLHVKRSILHHESVGCLTKWIHGNVTTRLVL